ncbi:5-dehydro-2-deoxygluconokinase [Devosia pacifica]|uniref:5-dehydro-2-deoxygluconokinase n=1 Tax=Devosia pacifica TaxID=1335967 RepID=A0A918SFW3_9HYPH|nr:5-dehydro-2-deoxygluconokinase [Devosia pacifica]GHA36613.1 5-dehydro-2-deoxygluconokinase [Devosia pacifica]
MSESTSKSFDLDVITIGRASVDLYGQQIGTRLEDVGSFAKSVGGCPCNISVGTARLGLKSALITRVGAEQMGRFITEQLQREGVETAGIVSDPERLTALAILSVQSETSFPLLFYRDNCADNALEESDIDPAFIARSRAVLVTGTHFAKPNTAAAQRKAMKLAKENGAQVVFDIDYRPNLWGLAGHDAGDNRYIASKEVSERMAEVLPECDLIVGTEEEVLIAGGASDLHEALKAIRALSAATIVLKRGPMGCIVYDGDVPDDLEDGIVGKGFPIEVYNTLGAGDAFMSGFLRGWLRGEPHETSATWANACGAFAVSRLLCAPEIPTWTELQYFLDNGSKHKALRKDEAINHVHWATTRRREWPELMALAIDHRSQIEDMAGSDKAKLERIPQFKALAVEAAVRVAGDKPGFGMLLDDKYGREALFRAEEAGLWVARPLELPGSRPLRFEFSQDLGSRLIDWPVDHCAKVLCFYHPKDMTGLKQNQIDKVRTAYEAARKVGRELLVEIIAGKHGTLDDDTVAEALTEFYEAGIKPDWWKLEAQDSPAAWAAIDAVIEARDPLCRGVVLLGLDAPQDTLTASFAAARTARTVRGFAVGRTIFGLAARAWLDGQMSDEEAVSDMAERFQSLVSAWQRAKA